MLHYKGELVELLLESYQNAAARLRLPAAALPQPGQYLQAYSDDPVELLPSSLFAAGPAEASRSRDDFLLPVAGELPVAWIPGTLLQLRGPLGRGFQLPADMQRLALIALDRHPGRLLPLLALALERGCAVTLFADGDFEGLSLDVEIRPPTALPEARYWADFLALDLPYERVDELPDLLGLAPGELLPAGQALVVAPMPCAGIADCGVCTLETANGPRLACTDGPVFVLNELLPSG
jgi:NAD(P)H-flavin reductase